MAHFAVFKLPAQRFHAPFNVQTKFNRLNWVEGVTLTEVDLSVCLCVINELVKCFMPFVTILIVSTICNQCSNVVDIEAMWGYILVGEERS